jgi:hypothetical protein
MWTAYLDGNLTAQDAAAFEHEHPEAAAERESLARLTASVRLHSPAPQMRNADFFNESILRAITPRPASAPEPSAERRLWPLWGLAVASVCCLLAAGAIYALFVRGGGDDRPDRYLAQVVSVKAGDASLDATVLDADGLAVVWIDGLDQLPNDYVLE